MNAILEVLCSGCAWSQGTFLLRLSVYTYFRPWRDQGVWERINSYLRPWMRLQRTVLAALVPLWLTLSQ
ncbi:MAG: hypothetical protein BRC59_08285 [Cyanobacteria bacterium SW_4_48_29]|nr:MAG: hypothetical protein BRC59_08285 [Cyanobacteria bacterium SW_4_48_29]